MGLLDRIRSAFARTGSRAATGTGTLSEASRRAGALVGVHAGDSLGATFEFNPVGPARIPGDELDVTGGGAFGWNAGDATDDTDLTRAVLHAHLAAVEDPDIDIVRVAADNMATWRARGPRDIGGATSAGLRRYAETGDPRRAGAGQGSAGNGSLMRTIPTAVFADPADRARLSREISAVTHDDLTCQAACVAYNDIVADVIAGRPVAEAIDKAAALAADDVFGEEASLCTNCGEPTEPTPNGPVHTTNVSRYCETWHGDPDEGDDEADPDPAYAAAVDAVAAAVAAGRSLDLAAVAGSGQFPAGYPYQPGGGHVLHSLAMAVAAAEDPRPFDQVLSDVVQLGGDADTNGAIAGGLLGARDGIDAIPERWRDKLQYGSEFVTAAAASDPGQWEQLTGDAHTMFGDSIQAGGQAPTSTAGMCGASTLEGRRCMNTTTHPSGRCPAHR